MSYSEPTYPSPQPQPHGKPPSDCDGTGPDNGTPSAPVFQLDLGFGPLGIVASPDGLNGTQLTSLLHADLGGTKIDLAGAGDVSGIGVEAAAGSPAALIGIEAAAGNSDAAGGALLASLLGTATKLGHTVSPDGAGSEGSCGGAESHGFVQPILCDLGQDIDGLLA